MRGVIYLCWGSSGGWVCFSTLCFSHQIEGQGLAQGFGFPVLDDWSNNLGVGLSLVSWPLGMKIKDQKVTSLMDG